MKKIEVNKEEVKEKFGSTYNFQMALLVKQITITFFTLIGDAIIKISGDRSEVEKVEKLLEEGK